MLTEGANREIERRMEECPAARCRPRAVIEAARKLVLVYCERLHHPAATDVAAMKQQKHFGKIVIRIG
jgi:hypothetical protein